MASPSSKNALDDSVQVDPVHKGHGGHHYTPKRLYLFVFGWLILLLFLTVGAAFVNIGHWGGILVAYLIASVKAALIIMYFMHVRYSNKLTWVFATASFLWLAIFLGILMSDYWMRDPSRVPARLQRADPMTHVRDVDSALGPVRDEGR
jgi:cytochrome c oxidase subunit IV